MSTRISRCISDIHTTATHLWRLAPVITALSIALQAPLSAHAAPPATGGPSSLTVAPGGLTVTSAGRGTSLPPVLVRPSDRSTTVYLPLAPFIVRDMTGSGQGWHVTVQATPLATDQGAELPRGSLSMGDPLISCDTGNACQGRAAPPVILGEHPLPIDTGEAVTIASAAPGTGMGAYALSPASLTAAPSEDLALAIPSDAAPGIYKSTLLISVDSGP